MTVYGNPETGVMVLYDNQTWRTGANLGRYLGVGYGSSMPDERMDYLIRWGTSSRVNYVPSETTVNRRTAVSANTDKYDSLVQMADAGIPVPNHSTDHNDLRRPIFGRDRNHREGTDIEIYDTWSGVDRSRDFYVEEINADREFRVHVIDGRVAVAREKQHREEPSEDAVGNPERIRNYENGWRFVYPDDRPAGIHMAVPAVEAMGLDFGAVDLVLDHDGQPYVLEVNTAPSLSPPTLETYARELADIVGIEESDAEGFTETNLYDDATEEERAEWNVEIGDMWATAAADTTSLIVGGSGETVEVSEDDAEDPQTAQQRLRSILNRGE